MRTLVDPEKLRIAQEHRLSMKICRNCGKRNSINAKKCRKCRSKNLRLKRHQLRK